MVSLICQSNQEAFNKRAQRVCLQVSLRKKRAAKRLFSTSKAHSPSAHSFYVKSRPQAAAGRHYFLRILVRKLTYFGQGNAAKRQQMPMRKPYTRFVWSRQTIVCSRQTIVWCRQTIVWCQQTMSSLVLQLASSDHCPHFPWL